MLTMNPALVSEVKGHDPSDVAKVAAALQKQATRDLGPLWEVQATVAAGRKTGQAASSKAHRAAEQRERKRPDEEE